MNLLAMAALSLAWLLLIVLFSFLYTKLVFHYIRKNGGISTIVTNSRLNARQHAFMTLLGSLVVALILLSGVIAFGLFVPPTIFEFLN